MSLVEVLLRADRPGSELERFLELHPELRALDGCAQDPRHHPEGDVLVHTRLVVDQAATLRTGEVTADTILMLAALCHDVGKPETTEVQEDRITAHGHDKAGVLPAREFLARLGLTGPEIVEPVVALVRYHLAPAQFPGSAKSKAYRRLARKLEEAGTDMLTLARLSRADVLGRATDDAVAGRAPEVDAFVTKAASLGLLP